MKVVYLIAIAAALPLSTAALAATDAETLFKQNNCAMCHATASASVGPSLQAIAAKYANVADAQTQLEKKVRKGGSGSFGSMPMPATPKSVSDETIKVLVRWTLLSK